MADRKPDTTTLREVLEGRRFRYFWVKLDGEWEMGFYAGGYGIFETMTREAVDYLEYAECPAIGVSEPT